MPVCRTNRVTGAINRTRNRKNEFIRRSSILPRLCQPSGACIPSFNGRVPGQGIRLLPASIVAAAGCGRFDAGCFYPNLERFAQIPPKEQFEHLDIPYRLECLRILPYEKRTISGYGFLR